MRTMRTYELILIIKKSISEGEQKKVAGFVKGLLKGAKFLKEDELGQKTLSYTINRENTGMYFDWNFDMETIPADFGKRLLENEGILRHLVIRKK